MRSTPSTIPRGCHPGSQAFNDSSSFSLGAMQWSQLLQHFLPAQPSKAFSGLTPHAIAEPFICFSGHVTGSASWDFCEWNLFFCFNKYIQRFLRLVYTITCAQVSPFCLCFACLQSSLSGHPAALDTVCSTASSV